ncbi:hypothetical protein BE17_52880 [Sorangium cellulosum]|uniref:Uncharacterized protein n=1 Tax=Sorangium cellulosum TaxID=56 RepID=A0A150RIT2_SORCE|nr:hypothetical protein BE17_52880 [Sorangium cellulosum]
MLLQIARDKGIPFIDLMASSAAWLDSIGRAPARAFYVDGDAARSSRWMGPRGTVGRELVAGPFSIDAAVVSVHNRL